MLRNDITAISERCCSLICLSFNFTKRKDFRIRGFECFRKEELNFDQNRYLDACKRVSMRRSGMGSFLLSLYYFEQ